MTKRNLADFLQDMLDGISEIEAFTDGVDFEAFQENREKTLAVIKLLEILGEAVKQIPDEKRSRYPAINWQGIAGMRDILVHEYWGVDVDVVWASIQEDVPRLKQTITEMFNEL